jgi:hypothetical protein
MGAKISVALYTSILYVCGSPVALFRVKLQTILLWLWIEVIGDIPPASNLISTAKPMRVSREMK